jgi:hypothetical protein
MRVTKRLRDNYVENSVTKRLPEATYESHEKTTRHYVEKTTRGPTYTQLHGQIIIVGGTDKEALAMNLGLERRFGWYGNTFVGRFVVDLKGCSKLASAHH